MRMLFLVTCLLFCINCTAQISYVPTEYTEFEPVSYYATSDGGFLTLKKMYRVLPGRNWDRNRVRYKLAVARYDKEMKLLKEQAISNGEEDFSSFYAELKLSGNKFWLICADPAEGDAIGNMKAIEIDVVTLQPGTIKILATKTQLDAQLNLYDGYATRQIIFESSPDLKHHFLFVGNSKEEFYLSGINEQLEPVWKGKRAFPDIKQKDIRSVNVDDAGNVFITAADKTGGYIAMYNAEGKAMYKTVLLGEDQTDNVLIHISKTTGQAYVAGTYRSGSDYASGVYYARLNKKDLTPENVSKTLFPEDIITRLKKDGFGSTKSKNYGIFSKYLSGKLYGKQGDALSLVLECKHELGDGRAVGVGSLLTVNFSGTNSSFSHIPRYAVSAGRRMYERFYAVVCKQQLILFYIDHGDNLDKSSNDAHTVLKGDKKAILTAAFTDDKSGTIKKAVEIKDGLDIWGSIRLFLTKACL